MTITASGSLKVVAAPDAFAAQAHGPIEQAVRAVLAEAAARGERMPPYLEAYVPQHGAARAVEALRALFAACYRAGYERARERG